MLGHHPHGSLHAQHAFGSFQGRSREGLTLTDRRGMLKAGLAGIAGLSLPDLLKVRAQADGGTKSGKSVILLWMAGGPSHIDTWDPKPDRPYMNRGPFGVTQTKLPGTILCEHLPKQAAMLDKFTIIRSVDCRHSNHEPNMVMQTANLANEPRVNKEAEKYPALASIVAKHHGANDPSMPPYVAFMRSRSHLAFAGYLGKQFDPFPGAFQLPLGLSLDRLSERRSLVGSFDRLRRDLDQGGSLAAMDSHQQQAVDMVLGRRAQSAFDIEREPAETRERFGKHLWCQQALIARRLVEAGVAFVTIDLSYHTASGTWDTHGDNIPPYGGIKNGLGPLLPLFDHLITTLVGDLSERGLLDNTLVIAMGEFGRTPQMGTQDSTDGRNHWPNIMSMCLAGGGFRHGQVIGASEPDGGIIRERPVTPGDLAATIFHHFGVPLDVQYLDNRGRPNSVLANGGQPLRELV
ncbi:MAG: Uncharacterized protein FD138_4661 [Planctomycetota bacterium]|nr:MAG: Uncharacterized protein FD138_4661 [Planctomycetota bacterium]